MARVTDEEPSLTVVEVCCPEDEMNVVKDGVDTRELLQGCEHEHQKERFVDPRFAECLRDAR